MSDKHQCLTCALAKWRRTLSDRLHPSGEGWCRWKMPEIAIPKSMYFLGYIATKDRMPQPSGGGIVRRPQFEDRELITDCPTYEALKGIEP